MKVRHYVVSMGNGAKERLVLATSQAAAVAHVVNSIGISARAAEKDDLVRLLTDGLTLIEVAKEGAGNGHSSAAGLTPSQLSA